MPIKITAEEFAEKQARRLKASTPDIRIGIERVTESPTAKAADKKDKMLANLQAAVNSGKWERGLRKVTLESWKDAALNKGLGRIAAGIDAAHDKVVDFASQLLPYEDRLQGEVNKMTDLTLEDNIARMTTWARGMNKFQKK